eukprot:CAMPEP_0204046192 /NCGR_PEP_ID=MMETSP0360-20130528/109903_1 /ASSEMBLY_ACC=CAM_ASM_000342 /TAXON_ID=268821 /ORGANISM="Scrippsiella Hangoei, Strain SHTV-5" /LENGTH=55 /DNA_ID=CAMNT_0050992773 /DNA_START=129 /DNA_END=292 /DNA_ORIENTATION=-
MACSAEVSSVLIDGPGAAQDTVITWVAGLPKAICPCCMLTLRTKAAMPGYDAAML